MKINKGVDVVVVVWWVSFMTLPLYLQKNDPPIFRDKQLGGTHAWTGYSRKETNFCTLLFSGIIPCTKLCGLTFQKIVIIIFDSRGTSSLKIISVSVRLQILVIWIMANHYTD
jgi:hypothetical protein